MLEGGADLQKPNADFTLQTDHRDIRSNLVSIQMQLPVKAHYATRAMLALAVDFQSGQLLAASTIAEKYHIPNQFLGQILQQLRSAGLISSVRGSSGGFKLARSPGRISLLDVIEAIGCGGASDMDATSGRDPVADTVSRVWSELSEIQSGYLQNITLEDLSSRLTPEPTSMFYI